MNPPSVVFLGGNGHADVRLEGVRSALEQAGQPFRLVDLEYPAVASYDELLAQLALRMEQLDEQTPVGLVYATGIGGLIALSLRARGALRHQHLVLQGAVLWGLERRWFPRLMRLPGMPGLLTRAFRNERVRARFVARHLHSTPAPEWVERFFAGYGDADAFARWFAWLTPALLRRLEVELAARPDALEQLEVWWGDADSVVGLEELRLSERALGRALPVRTFAGWSHYPMIDEPRAWVAEVSRALDAAGALL